MKHIVILLAFFAAATVGFTQSAAVKGNRLEVKGRMIGELSPTPHCGTVAFGTVVEFEVVESSDPNLTSGSVSVIFTCPESYGEGFFGAGKLYHLTIADENQADFEWSISNESLLTKNNPHKKLWIISAEVIDSK